MRFLHEIFITTSPRNDWDSPSKVAYLPETKESYQGTVANGRNEAEKNTSSHTARWQNHTHLRFLPLPPAMRLKVQHSCDSQLVFKVSISVHHELIFFNHACLYHGMSLQNTTSAAIASISKYWSHKNHWNLKVTPKNATLFNSPPQKKIRPYGKAGQWLLIIIMPFFRS